MADYRVRIDGYHVVLSMSQQSDFEVPVELVDQWVQQQARQRGWSGWQNYCSDIRDRIIATKAANWELEQCIKHIKACGLERLANTLQDSRRPPTPLVTKERAKQALSSIMGSQKGVFDYKPFKVLEEIINTLPDN